MNLKGGYRLIDLTFISLVLGMPAGDKTAITDKRILDQLLTLREYIEGDKELKPVYIRAKSTNGKDVVMASLARSVSGLNYYIDAKFTDTLLKLIVVFEQDEETLEYKIKSAEYLYTADVDNVQNEVTKAEDGTIVKVLGLDEDGKLVKGAVSGGTKLYLHKITTTTHSDDFPLELYFITTDANSYDKDTNFEFTFDNNFAKLVKILGCYMSGRDNSYISIQQLWFRKNSNQYYIYFSGIVDIQGTLIYQNYQGFEEAQVKAWNDTVTPL